jgi:hypothetical protein
VRFHDPDYLLGTDMAVTAYPVISDEAECRRDTRQHLPRGTCAAGSMPFNKLDLVVCRTNSAMQPGGGMDTGFSVADRNGHLEAATLAGGAFALLAIEDYTLLLQFHKAHKSCLLFNCPEE